MKLLNGDYIPYAFEMELLNNKRWIFTGNLKCNGILYEDSEFPVELDHLVDTEIDEQIRILNSSYK